jgi:hypothetical protein
VTGSHDDDPADLVARAGELLAKTKASKHPGWRDFDDAFKITKHARASRRMRVLAVGGEVALFFLGVAAALFVSYVTAADPVSQKEWTWLLVIAIPSAVIYSISLWERF